MDSEVSYIYKLIAIQKFHELISEEKQEYCLKKNTLLLTEIFEMTGEYELLDSSQNNLEYCDRISKTIGT